MAFEKAKRRLVIGTAVTGCLGWLIFGDKIQNGFDELGKAENGPATTSQSAFGTALHNEVAQAMQTGIFNTGSFETNEKSFLLYEGSIRDGTFTTLAEAGITKPTPQQSADANCALEAATFVGTEQLTPDMRTAYNEGRFEDAAELCLGKVIALAENDGFGKPGSPSGIVFPVGLAAR